MVNLLILIYLLGIEFHDFGLMAAILDFIFVEVWAEV